MAVNNTQIEKLYKELLDSWNKQDAKGMASLFAIDGSSVGFDGSQMNGKILSGGWRPIEGNKSSDKVAYDAIMTRVK